MTIHNSNRSKFGGENRATASKSKLTAPALTPSRNSANPMNDGHRRATPGMTKRPSMTMATRGK